MDIYGQKKNKKNTLLVFDFTYRNIENDYCFYSHFSDIISQKFHIRKLLWSSNRYAQH